MGKWNKLYPGLYGSVYLRPENIVPRLFCVCGLSKSCHDKKEKSSQTAWLRAFLATGDERIELPLKVLETLVIPFDQSPLLS